MKINICKNFMSNLFVIKNLERKFTRLFADNGEEVIVYSLNGNILIPNCVTIKNFTIQERTKNCYKDLPVTFSMNQAKINGFLTNDRILVSYSEKVDCSDKKKFYMIGDAVIAQKGQKAFFEHKFNKVPLTNERIKNNDLNFHHSQLVIEGLGSNANVPDTNKVL